MSNRFNLFALTLYAVMLALSFGVCREPAEAEEPPPEPPVKVLALDKQKRQQNPPEEPEAQLAPWANKIENCTVTYYDCCVKCCGNAERRSLM